MARTLTEKAIADYMQGGVYHEFLNIVKEDKELAFEIRTNNRVMIYCEKNLILTIKHNRTGVDSITMLSDRYVDNREDGLQLTSKLCKPTDLMDRDTVRKYLFQAKALCKNYKNHEEFKVQQWYESQNLSDDRKYLALDMEWAPDQAKIPVSERLKDKTQVDLLLVSNTPNEKGEHDIYLTEVKCGFGAIDGTSGLGEHLRLSNSVIENVYTRHNVKADAMNLIKQKSALGIINIGDKEYKLSSKPKVMFILAYTSKYQVPHLQRAVEELDGAEGLHVEYLDVSHFIPDAPASVSNNESEYKSKQRKHQSEFRETVLRLKAGEKANRLIDADAYNLKNFVPSFHNEIKESIHQRYKKGIQDKGLLNDMLSSKCVPWNFFIPMLSDKDAASKLFAEMLGLNTTIRIENCKIEYATNGIDDKTAFDAYFDYKTEDGRKGAIGIEVKYTEEGYKVDNNQYEKMKDKDSRYSVVTRQSDCFINSDPLQFNYPGYIQIWRNHLLGLELLQNGKVDIFHSVTLFPSENTHFASTLNHKGALELYSELLTEKGKQMIVPVTYERLLELISKYYHSDKHKEWISYMEKRYISK